MAQLLDPTRGASFMNDLRGALRTLAHSPGFTVTAIATLAAGIAANTTVLTLLNNLALRTIPAPEPGRLVRVYPLDANGRRENLFPYADYLVLRASVPGLRDMVGYIPETVTLREDGIGRAEPREALAYLVSGSYFSTIGATT